MSENNSRGEDIEKAINDTRRSPFGEDAPFVISPGVGHGLGYPVS